MIFFLSAILPELKQWHSQVCSLLLQRLDSSPWQSKTCFSATELDSFLSVIQQQQDISQNKLLINYHILGEKAQLLLTQKQGKNLYLYLNPELAIAQKMKDKDLDFSLALLDLFIYQPKVQYDQLSSTFTWNYLQFQTKPLELVENLITAFGFPPNRKLTEEIIIQYPLPKISISHGSPSSQKKSTQKKHRKKGFQSSPTTNNTKTQNGEVSCLNPLQTLLTKLLVRNLYSSSEEGSEQNYQQQIIQLISQVNGQELYDFLAKIEQYLINSPYNCLDQFYRLLHDNLFLTLKHQGYTQQASEVALQLGKMLKNSGHLEVAKEFYRESINLTPNLATGYANLGFIAQQEEDLNSAMGLYAKALECYPDYLDVYYQLGLIHRQQQRWDLAENCFLNVLRIEHQHQLGKYNLVKVLQAKQQLYKAKQWFSDDEIDLLSNLDQEAKAAALKLFGQKEFEQAEKCFLLAIDLEPQDYQNYFNLAILYEAVNKNNEAIKCYKKALECKSDHIESLNNISAIFLQLGRFSEAIEYLGKILALQPENSMALHNISIAYLYQGRIIDAIQYSNQAFQLDPDNDLSHSHLLAAMSSVKQISSHDVTQVSQVWYEQHVVCQDYPLITNHDNSLALDRRLRVGFVSGDFKRHSVSFFMIPILQNYNREQLEIYCYANIDKPDSVTEELKQHSDAWRDTIDLSDWELAELIKDDQIDILIDLSGHTLKNRLKVFGMKPAPIQATYLGYPATTGIPTVDYWLTDENIHPPHEEEEQSVETIWRLPRCYLCYDPPKVSPDILELPYRKTGIFTFGSFNSARKLSPELIKMWSEILQRVPNSRLLLKCSDPRYSPELMIQSFAEHGVERHRLIIYRSCSFQDHLNLYNQVDLHLDSMPYTGCTTTCEALWMGVPTLTLAGKKKMERMSYNILHTIGLDDFITYSEEEYINRAVALVSQPDYLQSLRETMRHRLLNSDLLNGKSLAETLENAFRQMWHKYVEEKSTVKDSPSQLDSISDISQVEVLINIASEHQQQGNLKAAAEIYDHLGEYYREQKNIYLAQQYYDQAINIDPDYAPSHYHLGLVYQQQNDLEKATSAYLEAISSDRSFAPPYEKLGQIYEQEGELEQAVKYYQGGLLLQPDNIPMGHQLGVLFIQQNKLASAQKCFAKNVQLQPEDAVQHLHLGIVYKLQRKLQKAAHHFEKALRLKEDYLEACYNLGVVYSLQGKGSQALEYTHQALIIDPDHKPSQSAKAFISASLP
jgi:predicted O-linked N-acetylglucosamine transferase (SPINDLY family)